MKRVFAALIVLTAIVIALVLLLPLLIPQETIKTRVAEEISGWTGRSVSVSGEPVVRLFPRPTVELKDVRISGPSNMENADLASIMSLKGSVRFLPLLIGKIDIDNFELIAPKITLLTDAEGHHNWLFDSSAAALHLAFSGDVPLGNFTVRDGLLTFQNEQTDRWEEFSDVSLTLDWKSVRRPLTLSGSTEWRSEPLTLNIGATRPFDFLRGQDTPISAELSGQPFSVSLSGEASNIRNTQFAGDLSFDSPDLGTFLAWLRAEETAESNVGEVQLNGHAKMSDSLLEMSDLKLRLDDNRADGALRLGFGGLPVLSGTLAFDVLDISPYFADLTDSIGKENDDWRDTPLDADWFNSLEADVRISANTVKISPLEFGSSAATLRLKDGSFDLGIGQSEVLGGNLSGALAMTKSPPGLKLESQLRADGFSLADLEQIGILAGLRGNASATGDLVSQGSTLGALVDSLQGDVSANVKDGFVPLVGLPQAAQALRTDSPALSFPAQKGTPFDRLDIQINVDGSALTIASSDLQADGFSAGLSGTLSLSANTLDLSGSIELDDASAPTPILVEGSIGDPVVTLKTVVN